MMFDIRTKIKERQNPLLPSTRAIALIFSYLLLSGLILEADTLFFKYDLLARMMPERSVWLPQLYVLFIFSATMFFRYYGMLISLLLSVAALVAHSLLISSQPWNSLASVFVILALGSVAGLYCLTLGDNARTQDDAKAFYEIVRRKYYNKTRQQVERDKQLAALSDYSQRVALNADIKHVIKIALDVARDTMNADAVIAYSLCEESCDLNLLAARGLLQEEMVKKQAVKLSECLNGKVARTGKTIAAYDYQEEFRLAAVLEEEGFSAVAVVPLLSRQKTRGTLMVSCRAFRLFSQQELMILETLGTQVGLAMENAILSSEKKAIGEKLEQTEKQYRELFEQTNDIIWLEDPEGSIIAGNAACARMLGVEPSSLALINIFSYMPQGDAGKALEMRRQLLSGTVCLKPYDQVVINAQGHELILNVSTNVMAIGDKQGFQHIAKDITEERRMQENLQHYVELITRAQEEERLRISRELHDSTAQSLIVVLHQLEKFCFTGKHLLLADSRFLFHIVEQVKQILQEVRQFSRDLRPSILDDLGLIPSLEWYIDELNRVNDVKIALHISGPEQNLRPEARIALFRIVQEALRNIIRHAQARRAEVAITFSVKTVTVVIKDNGKGFACRSLGDLLRHGKLGLAGMHERVKLLGGNFQISSVAGQGTTLEISFPLWQSKLEPQQNKPD